MGGGKKGWGEGEEEGKEEGREGVLMKDFHFHRYKDFYSWYLAHKI